MNIPQIFPESCLTCWNGCCNPRQRGGTQSVGTTIRFTLRVMIFALAVLAASAIAPQAQASWTGFTSTGSATGIGNPSCAQATSENVACAAMSGASAMMVNEYSSNKWGTWKSLTGTIVSNPSCTGDGDGKVFCAATASTGALEVAILTGTTWSAPTLVAAALYSAPSCAEYVAGEVLCLARNAAGGLAWSLYSSGKWSTFANLPTTAVSAPFCTSDHDSGVICSFFTIGGETIVNRFAAGTWKGFLNIGGLGGGQTDCSFFEPNGEVACFAKATESGALYVSTFNGGTWSASNWSSYGDLGGVANDNMSCATQSSGELACTAIGPVGNNEVYANVYSAGDWSGWNAIGGKGTGSPSCTPLTTGKVLCMVMGTNNELTSTVGP